LSLQLRAELACIDAGNHRQSCFATKRSTSAAASQLWTG
jgi:hypothetical protein